MLTGVELELIEDSLADQAEHDALLERLAPQRHAQARSHFAELEKRHRSLLERRRDALTKLVARASETMSQVTRRLRVLEEEYGFIRTHIFWVRDQEPIGTGTVRQVGHELRRLLVGLGKLAREVSEKKAWGPALDRVPEPRRPPRSSCPWDCSGSAASCGAGSRGHSRPATFTAASAGTVRVDMSRGGKHV